MKAIVHGLGLHTGFVLFVLFVSACGCRNKVSSDAIVDLRGKYIIHLDSIESAIDLCEAIEDFSFVELERNDTSPLASISKTLIVDSMCYLLDKKYMTVNIHNLKGAYLGRMGSLGSDRKNGEYFEIQDIIYRPTSNTIWLYTNGYSSIMEFDLKGRFIRNRQTDLFASSFAVTDSLYYYYINNNNSPYSKKYNVVITDTSRKVMKRLFKMPKTVSESLAFTGGIVSGKDYILLSPLFENAIYRVDGLDVSLEFEIDFGRYSLPPNMVSTANIMNRKIDSYGYLTSSFGLSSDVLAFGYRMDRKTLWGFFNKKNNHTALLKSRSNFPKKLLHSRFNEAGNQIVSSLPNADGILSLETSQRDFLEKKFPSFKASTLSIKDASNPLLIFIKMKDF